MKKFILNPRSVISAAGGAFIGYALFNDTKGAIIGGIIGFILSMRY